MKTDNEHNSCLNCIHRWKNQCVLFDELIIANGCCYMHNKK